MDGFAASEQGQVGIRVDSHPDPASQRLAIRLAFEDELDAVAALFGPAIDGYRGTSADLVIDAYLAIGRQRAGEWEVVGRSAISAGRIVGSVAFYPDVALEGWSNFPSGWTGFRALVVDPAARGAGIGLALVERCLVRSRELGASVLGIHTADILSDAVRLYRRLGFVRCPGYDLATSIAFPAAGADVTAIAFRYQLLPSSAPTGPRTVIEPGSTT